MNIYSTPYAAKKLRLGLRTLKRYMADRKVPAPKAVKVGDKSVRMWTDADIEKVREVLPKLINGRKTRYKKTVNSSQLSVVSKGKKKKNRNPGPKTRN